MMVLQKTSHLQSYYRCPLPDFFSGANSSSCRYELQTGQERLGNAIANKSARFGPNLET